jgi:hypothetical protein
MALSIEQLHGLAQAVYPTLVRPGFAGALDLLMKTPGASTESKEFMAELSLAEAERLINPPITNPEDTQMTDATDATEPDEIDDELILEADLADLALDLTTYWSKLTLPPEVILAGPESLTVFHRGGFQKRPHIGGEEFIPFEAYIGKKGRVIVKFRSREAVDYDHMEMFADDALAHLHNFRNVVTTESGSYMARIANLNRKRSDLRAMEKAKDKFDEYDDFGTF